jgi:hypothetical protein
MCLDECSHRGDLIALGVARKKILRQREYVGLTVRVAVGE